MTTSTLPLQPSRLTTFLKSFGRFRLMMLLLAGALLLPMQARSQDFTSQSRIYRHPTEWTPITATPYRVKNGQTVILRAQLVFFPNNNRSMPTPLPNQNATLAIDSNSRKQYFSVKTDGQGWVTFPFRAYDQNPRPRGRRVGFGFMYGGDSIYRNRTRVSSFLLIP